MSGELQVKSGNVMSKYCQVKQVSSWIGQVKSGQGDVLSCQIRLM